MAPDVNEVVMMDGDGHLYEGLSSNFFVVENDTIVTAPPQYVLSGTIASMVRKGCSLQ